MFEAFLSLIRAHDTIIIHRHKNPDGDALGSQIGLKHIILENFPRKTVYMAGDAAGRYGFMADSVMDEIPDAAYTDALAIILDTSARALISDDRYGLAARTARVDHHIFCEKIAEEEITDSSYESCCGLIAQFALESGLKLNPAAARALFTGMVTDSGRFRYDATSANTFRLASFLMSQPIDTNEIYQQLYENDFALPLVSIPIFMSAIMSDVFSVRLLSEVTIMRSAIFVAIFPISGLLVLSLSPPHPNRHISSLSGAVSLRVLRTFSRASGVWA